MGEASPLQGIEHRGPSGHANVPARLSRSWDVLQSISGTVANRLACPLHLQPWADPRPRSPTIPGSWRVPAAALTGSIAQPGTSVSHELTHSHRDRPSEPPPLLTSSEDFAARAGSLHAVLGAFSTSGRGGPPTRGSIPASFRLRRFSGLDGLLPPRPCRLVSSGCTHDVPWPRRPPPRCRSSSRSFTPAESPWPSSVEQPAASKLTARRSSARGSSEEPLRAPHRGSTPRDTCKCKQRMMRHRRGPDWLRRARCSLGYTTSEEGRSTQSGPRSEPFPGGIIKL